MHFSGLIVALSAGLAAASPIVEKKDSGLCPEWGGLPELWHGLACCGWESGLTTCCRLPAGDKAGAYLDYLPCTSEWVQTVEKYTRLVYCNQPKPRGDCTGVPILGKKP
ncbi:hypothetical protein RB594_009597 [Gaeumannomyces avenae]